MDNLNTPYEVKTLQYEDGIFNNYIDATYVIHLKGNGREQHIFEELSKIHPTNNVHIVYNEGFKKCNKGPTVKTTVDDLTHAYLWTFEHAHNQKYKNILILEDDFIFSEKIKDATKQQNIFNILKSRENEDYIFLLGSLPFLLIPRDKYTYTGITCGMHCVIYSSKCISNTLANRKNIIDWDIFFNFVSKTTNKYIYYEPLCYQLFPLTENSKNWGLEHIILYVLSCFAKPVMKLCKLDNQTEPGYSIFYIFSKFLGFFLLGIVVYIILVYPFIRNFENYYNKNMIT